VIDEQRFNEVITDVLAVSTEKIKPDANFVDDLGADSLDQVELLMKFEDEYDIEISDEEAEKIQTVQQAKDYITKNI